jgi:hypothetical protein
LKTEKSNKGHETKLSNVASTYLEALHLDGTDAELDFAVLRPTEPADSPIARSLIWAAWANRFSRLSVRSAKRLSAPRRPHAADLERALYNATIDPQSGSRRGRSQWAGNVSHQGGDLFRHGKSFRAA